MWQLQTIFSEYFSHAYRYFRGTLSIPYREFFRLNWEMLYGIDIFIKEEKYKYFCMYKYIEKEMCTKYWIYNIILTSIFDLHPNEDGCMIGLPVMAMVFICFVIDNVGRTTFPTNINKIAIQTGSTLKLFNITSRSTFN